MLKILVSDSISEVAIKDLQKSGADFTYSPEISKEDLLKQIPNFDALIVRSRTKVTSEVIQNAKNLKVIGRAGVGTDNIDMKAAKARGIRVVNTPNALTNAVGEFTIALMLCLARKIPLADSSLRRGKWLKSSISGQELKGKVYGTIGIGRIGARVAELAHAFGMEIMANDIIPIPDELIQRLGVKVATQDEIFRSADYVDLHVPLTPETEGLVNYSKMSKMKKSSYLINTSRGKVVNEEDLLKAINEGLIAGAALDVFDTEPPTRDDLLKNERVVLTPHIAGQTEEAQSDAGKLVVQQILELI
jgi:D-3-phosphoglycerate dehydrogenase / 2-oxoglutarate reductase